MMSERMRDESRVARIVPTARQTLGDAQPLFDLAQQQNAAVRGEKAAVEFGDDHLARNR